MLFVDGLMVAVFDKTPCIPFVLNQIPLPLFSIDFVHNLRITLLKLNRTTRARTLPLCNVYARASEQKKIQ